MDRSRSLANLQTALTMELAAAQQYLLNAHLMADWGLELLATKMQEEVQDEMGHAGAYIERILFLGGDPELVPAAKPQRAQGLKDLFRADLEAEQEAIAFYARAAAEAAEDLDLGTRALFERIVLDEEGHAGWIDLQLSLIDRMGEGNYIAKHTNPGAAA